MNNQRAARCRRGAGGMLSLAAVLTLWEVIGREKLLGPSFPPLSDVLTSLGLPYRRHLYARATWATLSAAALGYGIGLVSGFVAATAGHVLPGLRPGLDRLASLIHAIPMIALAPLFMIMLAPGSVGAAVAAIGVFFIAYVASCTALEAARPTHRDLFQAFGASTRLRVILLDLPSALPALAAGLRQAVPVAFLGTILGEWFGSAHGLGMLMVSAMENFQIPLLWSAVILCCGLSLCLFALLGLLERTVTRRYR